MTWFLDLRATAVGGITAASVTATLDGVPVALDSLRQAVAGRDVMLVTHGFNVDRARGIATIGGWAGWLQLPAATAVVGILWAGDSRWAPVLDYPVEGDEAITAANLLAPFLAANFAGAAGLSFASHSLGARLVLHTMRLLQRPVRRLILMAAAIEDTCLAREYADAAALAQGITVLASRADTVLHWAFPIGNLGRDLIDALHPGWATALGRTGPATPVPGIQAGWQIPDAWGFDHGNYLGVASGEPAFPPPVDMPDPNPAAPPPRPLDDAWKPAWSAGVAATRMR